MQVAEDLIAYLDSTPQPVAMALGRVVRVNGPAERREACLKAAEVVARYLAVIGLASAAAARDDSEEPLVVETFDGDLSFGCFETAARAACNAKWNHPLRDSLRACLRSKKKPQAGIRLESLVQLRNQLGHSLTPADDSRARVILSQEDPIGGLIEVVEGLSQILCLPLIVLVDQRHVHGRLEARLSLYLGEAEPIPRQVILATGIYEWHAPYLCTEGGIIPLSPGLLPHHQPDGRLGLYLIDGITQSGVRYKSVLDNSAVTSIQTLCGLCDWLKLPFVCPPSTQPRPPLVEAVSVEDSRSLMGYLRGDPVSPNDTAGAIEMGTATDQETFEQRASRVGVGTPFRDILYCLMEMGHRTEPTPNEVRIVANSEPRRVLLTMQLDSASNLVVSVLPGAFDSGKTCEKETVHSLCPGESADEVLQLITSLHQQ